MFASFLSVALIHFFSVISPGPGTFILINGSIHPEKKVAYQTLFGIYASELICIALTFAGVSEIIQNSALLYRIIQVIGGLYLMYIGQKMTLLNLKKHLNVKKDENVPNVSNKNVFFNAFFIGVTNVKNYIFYIAIFSDAIEESTSNFLKMFYFSWISTMSLVYMWFTMKLLRIEKIMTKFQKNSTMINLVFGIILLCFGLKLLIGNSYI